MNIDFEELIKAELTLIFEAIEAFGVDIDTFQAYSLSCVMGYGWEEYGAGFEDDDSASRGITLAEELGLPEDEAKKHRADFNWLCGLAPIVPRSVFGFLGTSYWTLMDVRNGTHGYDTPQRKLEGLVLAARGSGRAAGISEKVELQLAESFRKASLSRAGVRGAATKNSRTQELKSWAINKAVHMRGADIDLARQLSAQLPADLADASKAPERLIYDALRTRKKGS